MYPRTLSCYLSFAVLVVAVCMLTGCADWAAARATAPMSEQMHGNFTGAPPKSANTVVVCETMGMSASVRSCTQHSLNDVTEALGRRLQAY